MHRNVGTIDRVIRLLLAVALVAAAYFWVWWLVIPAAVLAGTALVGWCPLYCPFQASTCCGGKGACDTTSAEA